MAIGVFRLTHHQRYRLAIILCILNGIEMLIGLGITVNSIYVYMAVAPGLYSERAEISFVFLVMAIFGTHVLLVYLAGMKICERCYLRAMKRTTKHLYIMWCIMSANTIINLLVISTMFVKISKHIVRSMRHSLEKGMRKYLKDDVWKRTVDDMQYRMQCCGIDSYKDWYITSWMNKYNVNPDHDTIKSLRLSEDSLHLPVVPWSCCKLDFPMQCFHDPLQQLESAHIWTEEPDLVTSSIYENGCLQTLRHPVQTSLSVYVVLVVFIVLIHIAIMVLTKYLFSACKNAAILMNTGGVAPGWLFGRGDFGYNRGKTLYEIMETTERSNFESPATEDLQTSMREENITERSEENPVSPSHERDLLLR